MHHDAITGTSPTKVTNDFNNMANVGKAAVLDMHATFLREKVEQHHGVKILPGRLFGTMDFRAT